MRFDVYSRSKSTSVPLFDLDLGVTDDQPVRANEPEPPEENYKTRRPINGIKAFEPKSDVIAVSVDKIISIRQTNAEVHPFAQFR